MTYKPGDYKDLFPQGLFEFTQKPIKTWADSHRLFALNAIPFENKTFEIASGLIVKRGHIKQNGGFSNYMIFEINPKIRKTKIEFFQDKMLYPIDVFEKLDNPFFITNAGYFYLTDDEKKDPCLPPKIRVGNLVINQGKLFNLPILDRGSLVFFKDGSCEMYFLRSVGKVLIDEKKFEWVGSKSLSSKSKDVIVYNSSNIIIGIVNDSVMGPSRMAEKVYINCPEGKKLLVCNRKDGVYFVAEILERKVLINDKDMVLEVESDIDVVKGSLIKFLNIDNLEINKVESALSAGPIIFHDYESTKKEVLKEFSVSDMANPVNPHEETKKLARGCFLKLKDGRMISVLVDGIPQAGSIYPGVTLKEFVSFVNSLYPDFKSAVATDPSSSMKGIYKNGKKTEVFGNLHYLDHKRDKEGKIIFWPNGRNGRKVNSVIAVY